jgi:hypothetical protein
MYKDGRRQSFVNDDSFIWATLEPDEGSSLRIYRGKMTPEEPLDDDMFINANFRAKRADTESRSQDRI